ncbi:BMC domain-containing protein [Bacillus sp. REN3]|uniref:BMC domain-containing protein n=1 Tax=Bacillus sp. REN3 TaxID=2802440 RepID=UPI001AEDD762|nr:BMC domain-containing protein [Bacillus sp. REN3]
MARAMGMIETRGLVGSVEAADAMLKAADVSLLKQEKVDAALVTVLIQGDVSAVQAAIDAGSKAATRVGELISAHVIPHPDEDVGNILFKKAAEQKHPAGKEPAERTSGKNQLPASEGKKPARKEKHAQADQPGEET